MNRQTKAESKPTVPDASDGLCTMHWEHAAIVYVRMALGTAFLSAVASRFGLWDHRLDLKHFANFLEYTAQVNSFMPKVSIPYIAWTATICETSLGILLISGVWPGWVSLGAALLLAMFGTAMAISLGLKSPLDYSVFSASGAAVLLALRASRRSHEQVSTPRSEEARNEFRRNLPVDPGAQRKGANTVSIMPEKNLDLAEAYYKAMNDKDIAGVARYLHPQVQFVGPMASLAKKEPVLEAAKRFMSLLHGIRIRARFGSESQAMLTVDADFGETIGICRTTVLMTFRDDLIAQIELFYDARPFEKNLQKDAIFSTH